MTGAIAVVSICEDPNGRATAFRTTARAVHSLYTSRCMGPVFFERGDGILSDLNGFIINVGIDQAR